MFAVPRSLLGARKKQNKVAEYRKMLLEWKRVGGTVFAGYILGFPSDTPESILRDIKIIQRELRIPTVGIQLKLKLSCRRVDGG